MVTWIVLLSQKGDPTYSTKHKTPYLFFVMSVLQFFNINNPVFDMNNERKKKY